MSIRRPLNREHLIVLYMTPTGCPVLSVPARVLGMMQHIDIITVFPADAAVSRVAPHITSQLGSEITTLYIDATIHTIDSHRPLASAGVLPPLLTHWNMELGDYNPAHAGALRANLVVSLSSGEET